MRGNIPRPMVTMIPDGWVRVAAFHNIVKTADEGLIIWSENIGFYAPQWVVSIAVCQKIKVAARVALIRHVRDDEDLQMELLVRRSMGEKMTPWLANLAARLDMDVLRFWDLAWIRQEKAAGYDGREEGG